MKFKTILTKEEGNFIIEAPELATFGLCATQGKTIEEAVKNIKEAIECFIKVDDFNESKLEENQEIIEVEI